MAERLNHCIVFRVTKKVMVELNPMHTFAVSDSMHIFIVSTL